MQCHTKALLCLGLSCLFAAAAGCGNEKIYPVEGRVVFADGTPATELAGGLVIFASEEAKGSSRGAIQADGTFRLSTIATGDGAYLGKNRISVSGPRKIVGVKQPASILLDPKYADPETSGLEYTVVAGQNKDVEVMIERKKGP